MTDNNCSNKDLTHAELRQFALDFVESGDYKTFEYGEIQIPINADLVFAMLESLVEERAIFEYTAHDGETYYVKAKHIPVFVRDKSDEEIGDWLYNR